MPPLANIQSYTYSTVVVHFSLLYQKENTATFIVTMSSSLKANLSCNFYTQSITRLLLLIGVFVDNECKIK